MEDWLVNAMLAAASTGVMVTVSGVLGRLHKPPLFDSRMNVQDWCRHVLELGMPGKGKSTLMFLLARHLVQNGWSAVVIACQGELWKLVSMLDDEFLPHIVPMYPWLDRVLGYNPLRLYRHTDAEVDRIAMAVTDTFRQQNTRAWGSEIERAIAFAVKLVLIGEQKPNLVLVWKALQSDDYRNWLTEQVDNPIIADYFQREFKGVKNAVKKVASPLANNALLSVLAQDEGLDLLECMNTRRIVLCDLDEAGLGPASAQMGGLLLAGVRHAASMRNERSQPCIVCVDEWQTFAALAGESLLRLLEIMRKKNVCLLLSSQATYQFPESLQDAAWLAGNRFIFDPDPGDSSALKKAFGEEWETCKALPDRSFVAQNTVRGARLPLVHRRMREVQWLRTEQQSMDIVRQLSSNYPMVSSIVAKARSQLRQRTEWQSENELEGKSFAI